MTEISILAAIFASALGLFLLWRRQADRRRLEERRRHREAIDEAWEHMLQERARRQGVG